MSDYVMTREDPSRQRCRLAPARRNIIAVLDEQGSAIKQLVEAVMPEEWHVRTYRRAKDLIDCRAAEPSTCLLLGDHLPGGQTGLQVISELQRINRMIPTLVISERRCLRHVVTTMRAGADGFLVKPLDPVELLEDLFYALSKSGGDSKSGEDTSVGLLDADAQERVSYLNAREVQVVRLVVKGLMNKEIANLLGLALITVKVYRGRAMKKLGAKNSVEMYQIVVAGGMDLGPQEPKQSV